MANGREHTVVGSACGGAAAFLLAGEQVPGHRLVETLGGALGGALGGRLPDVLEPALHAWHRGPAHAMVPAATASAMALPRLRSVQQQLRQSAERCRAGCGAASAELDRLFWSLAELLCRLAAGAIPGIAAGYVSHLVLDADTPRGLPLLA